MRVVVLVAFILLFNVGCSQIKEKHITEVSREEFKNVVLVDVRTPREYYAGHLDDALNIDWRSHGFLEQFKGIGEEDTIYLYCRSGRRSADATRFLDSMGYKHVYNLKGGYIALRGEEKK